MQIINERLDLFMAYLVVSGMVPHDELVVTKLGVVLLLFHLLKGQQENCDLSLVSLPIKVLFVSHSERIRDVKLAHLVFP